MAKRLLPTGIPILFMFKVATPSGSITVLKKVTGKINYYALVLGKMLLYIVELARGQSSWVNGWKLHAGRYVFLCCVECLEGAQSSGIGRLCALNNGPLMLIYVDSMSRNGTIPRWFLAWKHMSHGKPSTDLAWPAMSASSHT